MSPGSSGTLLGRRPLICFFYYQSLLSICGANSNGKFLSYQVPDPVAFFPLNFAYGTREIQDRVPQGITSKVMLAPGPGGELNGSYEFNGTSNSFIEFSNSAGGVLDVRYSITMLCWVYYDGQDGPFFFYGKDRYKWGVHLATFQGELYARFHTRTYGSTSFFLRSTPLEGGWKFVGASYDHTSGEAKLWVDGVAVYSLNNGANLELGTQDKVRMGVADSSSFGFFKGRITQMRVYDTALTQEQIQDIQGKME